VKHSTNHRQPGSASHVLTATGFVNETPNKIDTPQPINQTFVTGDYVGDPYSYVKLGHIRPRGHLGIWVKYNQNYFYLYGTHLRVRPVDGFSRMMVQTTRTRARMCLFGICSHYFPFMEAKSPQKHFGA